MYPDMKDGLDGAADYERDLLTLELPDGLSVPNGKLEFSLGHVRRVLDKPYHVDEPTDGWKRSFTEAEKAKLRPIAETLAMLDGNAFFGQEGEPGHDWYEGYLSEAHAIYESNGGDKGWAGEASFAKSHHG